MPRFTAYFHGKRPRCAAWLATQRLAVTEYVRNVEGEICASFEGGPLDDPEWLGLKKAIHACKLNDSMFVFATHEGQEGYELLISRIANAQIQLINAGNPQNGSLIVHEIRVPYGLARKVHSARTKAGLARARAKGKSLGNPAISKQSAAAVNAAKLKADHFARSMQPVLQSQDPSGRLSASRVAKLLNEALVRGPRGGLWTASGVIALRRRLNKIERGAMTIAANSSNRERTKMKSQQRQTGSINAVTTSSRLEVRARAKMSEAEIAALKRAKLHDLAPLEAWTAIGTNRELAYATHGAMRFFGKFPPPIATYLIDQYAAPGTIVLDPMCGSGTTAVECLLSNRAFVGLDVNPLMVLLAKVKTTRIDKIDATAWLEQIHQAYKPASFRKISRNLKGLSKPEHWFLPETLNGLAGLKVAIDQVSDTNIRHLLTIAMLAIVRRVSRATTQQGRLFLDVKTAEKDVLPFFVKKAKELIESASGIPDNRDTISIECGNILNEPTAQKHKEQAQLVILHPPYFNSYKYSGVTSLEAYWLGIDHADVRRGEVREFFKVGKPEKHEVFVADMARGLKNALTFLKAGGRLGLMMGDTVIKGEYIPVMRKTLAAAGVATDKIERVALRVPKYTEASWAASQRRRGCNVGIPLSDFVIVIKK